MAGLAYVVGNSPYYQCINEMAKEAGLEVKRSFNTDYEELLPQAAGHVLLIETHNGEPIVDRDLLEKHFPGAHWGLNHPDGTTRVGETTIVFLEFSRQLKGITG